MIDKSEEIYTRLIMISIFVFIGTVVGIPVYLMTGDVSSVHFIQFFMVWIYLLLEVFDVIVVKDGSVTVDINWNINIAYYHIIMILLVIIGSTYLFNWMT